MNEQKNRPGPTLNEVYKLTKENNKMLRAMRRDAFRRGVFGFIWWVLILVVLPYVSWLFIQPYLEGALNLLNQVQGGVETLNTTAQGVQDATNSIPNFGDLLKQFGSGN